MPKPMYVWSGSAWVSVATEVESLATYATQSYADNVANVAAGLKPIVPSSVAIGSGSSSISTLGAVTFTGASSVSLNGVFTSAYNNYRILIDLTSAASPAFYSRLRKSGTDATTNYNFQGFYFENTTVSAFRSTSVAQWQLFDLSTDLHAITIDLFNPYVNAKTSAIVSDIKNTNSSPIFGGYANGHNTTDTYDGITFYPASSTVTGSISVYGYKK